MPAFETLDDFLSTDEFAVTAQIGSPGAEVDVVGIFDNTFERFEDGETAVTVATPNFLAKTSDCQAAGVTHKTRLLLDAKTYRISEIEDDGTGFSRLLLRLES